MREDVALADSESAAGKHRRAGSGARARYVANEEQITVGASLLNDGWRRRRRLLWVERIEQADEIGSQIGDRVALVRCREVGVAAAAQICEALR